MSRVPADIDSMMWQIAERGDSGAAAEFCERFPHLANDLASRMEMVGGLKGLRSTVSPDAIPAFTPKFMWKRPPAWRRFAPTALGLATLAAASYYITHNLVTPLPDPLPPEPVITKTQPKPKEAVRPAVVTPAPRPELEFDGPFPVEANRTGQRKALHFSAPEGMSLRTAVSMIAAQDKLKLEIPADFPYKEMETVDITGGNSMELLTKLGEKYGFTPFSQTPGTVLLVPARPESEQPVD